MNPVESLTVAIQNIFGIFFIHFDEAPLENSSNYALHQAPLTTVSTGYIFFVKSCPMAKDSIHSHEKINLSTAAKIPRLTSAFSVVIATPA
jgi:hypothetical protein